MAPKRMFAVDETEEQPPDAKRPKMETSLAAAATLKQEETKEEDPKMGPKESIQEDATKPQHAGDRWKAHQMMEDYVETVANLMNPGIYWGPPRFGGIRGPSTAYLVERMTLLGYLESPCRRRTVWESWSPYEISIFEAAISLCGKRFHRIAKRLPHKTTKDVVAFYYVWKKTWHYKNWKREYVPEEDEIRFQSPNKKKKKK